MERSDRSDRLYMSGGADRADGADRSDRSGVADRPDGVDRSGGADKARLVPTSPQSPIHDPRTTVPALQPPVEAKTGCNAHNLTTVFHKR